MLVGQQNNLIKIYLPAFFEVFMSIPTLASICHPSGKAILIVNTLLVELMTCH